jgi:uncharacterized protein (TIGR02246 family)
MIRRLLITLGLGLLLLASPAIAQGKKEAKQAAADDVSTVLRQLYAAWGDLDPQKAAPFYAKDADLTFFDIAPMKYQGWSGYAAGVPKAFAPYKSAKFTLNDDLRTHLHGNLAWATATWHGELIKKDGSTEKMDGRYTAVLEKRDGKWLVVHEHMSVPAPGQ